MKKYTANTDVCVNVLVKGVNRHVSFTPVTGKGSVFYTSDPDLQKALESHYKYGKLFKAEKKNESVDNTASGMSEASEDCVEPTERLHHITITDPDAAKAYLAEKFNVSRTKLNTMQKIKKCAAEHGVEFDGI